MQASTIARAVAGAGVAILLALGPGLASADQPNNTPASAVVLSGTVAGDVEAAPPNLGAGRQAFLRFEYPGDGSTVTVDVDITPGDLVSASHAGFKVYGPTNGKLYGEGGQTGKHPSHEVQFSSTEAGTYLLQVFNYNVTPIHYEASATGLPAQVVPTPVAQLAPTATPATATVGLNDSPDRVADLSGPVSAVLLGGSSHYYRLAYPGDGSSVRIDLNVSPASAGSRSASCSTARPPAASTPAAPTSRASRRPTRQP